MPAAFTNVLLRQWGNNHIAAPLWIRVLSYASLNVARNPITEMESYGPIKYAFIGDLAF